MSLTKIWILKPDTRGYGQSSSVTKFWWLTFPWLSQWFRNQIKLEIRMLRFSVQNSPSNLVMNIWKHINFLASPVIYLLMSLSHITSKSQSPQVGKIAKVGHPVYVLITGFCVKQRCSQCSRGHLSHQSASQAPLHLLASFSARQ